MIRSPKHVSQMPAISAAGSICRSLLLGFKNLRSALGQEINSVATLAKQFRNAQLQLIVVGTDLY